MARRCPYSWYQRPRPPALESNPPVLDPNLENNVPVSGDASVDPSPGGDVAAPAGDLGHPSNHHDSFRDILSADILADNDLLATALPTLARGLPLSSAQSSEESSGPGVLDSQGLLREQPISCGVVRNPPGLQSSADQGSMETDNQPSGTDIPHADPPDPPDDPPDDPPADPPVDPPDDLPDDPPADPSADSPINPPSGRIRPSPSFSRRKPAPMPPALKALSRRPTRPTLPGKPVDAEEMETQTSLKRKPVTTRKVAGPKKGKH